MVVTFVFFSSNPFRKDWKVNNNLKFVVLITTGSWVNGSSLLHFTDDTYILAIKAKVKSRKHKSAFIQIFLSSESGNSEEEKHELSPEMEKHQMALV